ncbi:DNA translocase FtsK [Patescibacteria group bacterium]|nr:DNA translocase FtsK [Patescibacteria group bacterium]
MARRRKKRRPYRRRQIEYEETGLLSAETKKGIAIVLLFVMAIITVLSLFNLAGALGSYIKPALTSVMGWGIYFLPVILITLAYFLLRPEKYEVRPSNYLGLIIFIFSYLGILQLIKGFEQTADLTGTGGGYLGFIATYPLQKFMGPLAAVLVMIGLFLISLLITFNTSLNSLFQKLNLFSRAKEKLAEAEEEYDEEIEEEPAEAEEGDDGWIKGKTEEDEESADAGEEEPDKTGLFTRKKIGSIPIKKGSKAVLEDLKVTFARGIGKKVQLPLSLLDSKTSKPTSGDIKANIEKIKTTLENFGIEVSMGEVNVGPTITQFTLKPIDGVKLSNITALQNDLALALAAHPLRIEAPIPGKSLVGIEVPNQSIATVKLKEIIDNPKFKKKGAGLTAALGKDVSGKIWTIDLANLPHLLIAGATGSGKSVCINSVIISLLFQNSPEQLRLILVDPKRVELTNYNGLPHLLAPVITDVSKTVNALRWAVREMDERFKLLEATGKRNINAYNAGVITSRLPYIVIIIDELADLMAVAAKDIEGAIVRLAQMARAVGIHLVVATQRPSVNIITGLIKANITSRIAFAVASSVDSRTILDFSGAEKLLGKGDMLYISAELSKPRRIQGALVTDEEIERVTDYWRNQAEPEFDEGVTEKQTRINLAGSGSFDENGDELLEEAKEIILRAGKASASFLQRRLRVGYARAARLLDLMEEQGIIGPADGAKPREILVNESVLHGEPAGEADEFADDEEEDDDDDESADDQGPDEETETESELDDEEEEELNEEIDEEEDNEDDKEEGKIKIHYKKDNNF